MDYWVYRLMRALSVERINTKFTSKADRRPQIAACFKEIKCVMQ